MTCSTEVSHEEFAFVPEDRYHPALSISCDFQFIPQPINFPSCHTVSYNFRSADLAPLCDSLLQHDWSVLDDYNDVNAALERFYSILYGLFDVYVPKTVAHSSRYPSWFTKEIKSGLKLKDYYRRKWRQGGSAHFHNEFRRLRSHCKNLISSAYTAYVSHSESVIRSNPKELWSFLRAKQGTTRIPGNLSYAETLVSNPQQIVNCFADIFSHVYLPASNITVPIALPDLPSFTMQPVSTETLIRVMTTLPNKPTAGDDSIPCFFIKQARFGLAAPLTKIINIAIKTSTFPNLWKRARIVPVFKKGDASDMKNYRPIAILSNFAKVFEQTLCSTIYGNVRTYISLQQHGFMAGRSTVTNLTTITQFISEVLDARGQVDVIYTDFSSAFDIINHDLLLRKLHSFGFAPSLLKLLASYLSLRHNYVFYNGYRSYEYVVSSGVPQGSNLGPLLFNLFINDLLTMLPCNSLGYADDIKIYQVISHMDDVALLQNSLDTLVAWSVTHKLTLNVNKCCVMSYTRKIRPLRSSYHIQSTPLQKVLSIKDLGVTFDPLLMFDLHINNICSAASRMLGFIIRSSKLFNDVSVMKALYYAFIVCKLEYASVVWYPYYASQAVPIERVQRRFLKFLSFRVSGQYPMRNIDYAILLNEHGMLALSERRKLHSAKFLYKLVNGFVDCADLLSMVKFHVPRISSREETTFTFETPRTNIMVKAPLTHMARNANQRYKDVFIGALKE